MLDELDYEILRLISKSPKVSVSQIAGILKIDETIIDSRLFVLCQPTQYSQFVNYKIADPNSSYVIMEDNSCALTLFGKSVLSNYLLTRQHETRNLYESRFWKFAPIAISIISLLKSYGFI